MQHIDPAAFAAPIALTHPLIVRTIGFDIPTFDALKDFQRTLEAITRRSMGNAEVLKYIICSHPGVGTGAQQ